MSKKIIYLLSLLMALSLVFASCKKNGITDAINNGGPQKPDTITPPTDDLVNGLFVDQSKLEKYNEKPVQASELTKYANKNYMRNPVMTVIDGQTVLVAYEIRYESPGSGNDTALTGTNVVDIVYGVSTDGGVSFENGIGSYKYVGKVSANGDVSKSHGAPIIYNTGDYIVVVASAGIGLSVGTYDGSTKVSKLEYSAAKINASTDGKGPTIGDFSEWQEVPTISIDDINNSSGLTPFKQYGTHSARGVVAGGKLLLPVTVAEFINKSGSWGDSRWGYVVYALDFSDGKITGATKKGNVVEMKLTDKTKATRIASADSADSYITLTVSDNPTLANLRLFKGDKNTTTESGVTKTDIQAGDGSAGTLVVDKWLGKNPYDPSEYAKTGHGNVSGGSKQAIVSHVLELEKKLAVRLVNEQFTKQDGTSFELGGAYANNSKSSTLDVLKDGTIVMIAEGGKADTSVSGRPFYIFFNRYTQAYLASQTGH